jgi:DNA-binding transcriptional ArsR family regulator
VTPTGGLDTVYQAIAHHTRRDILDLLRAGPKPATDIAARFSISQPAVSRQLRVLRQALLVNAETSGRQRIYRLDPTRLGEVHAWIGRYVVKAPSGHLWAFRSTRKSTQKGN